MTAEDGMSKETFLRMAEASGLDVRDDSHMEELYSYLQSVLPGLKLIQELDLAEVEPATVFFTPKE